MRFAGRPTTQRHQRGEVTTLYPTGRESFVYIFKQVNDPATFSEDQNLPSLDSEPQFHGLKIEFVHVFQGLLT